MSNKIDLDQIETGQMQLSCKSCVHSAYYPTQNGDGVWCQTHKMIAHDTCGDFSYEPGTSPLEWEDGY